MSNEDLAKYVTKLGDRCAIRRFCAKDNSQRSLLCWKTEEKVKQTFRNPTRRFGKHGERRRVSRQKKKNIKRKLKCNERWTDNKNGMETL